MEQVKLTDKKRLLIRNCLITFFLLFIIPLSGCRNHEVANNEHSNVFRSKFRRPDYTGIINYKYDLNHLIDSLNASISSIYIVVDKSDFILSILSDSLLIKQYPVVLGKNPIDEKLVQGDNCTPEGIFKIKAKYAHKKWSKFIWLNYPTEESISKIKAAKDAGIIPLDSSPGGDIGIHGVEEGFDYAIDYGINWTAGCIALKNKDVNEIYLIVNEDTKIIIQK